MRIVVKPLGIVVMLLVLCVAGYILFPRQGDTSTKAPTPAETTSPAGAANTPAKTQVNYEGGTASILFGNNDAAIPADSVSKGEVAEIIGGANLVPGIQGNGLHFDGAHQQHVDLGKSVLDTSREFSVACWVKLDDVKGYQTFVSQDGGNISGFYLQKSDLDQNFSFSVHSEDSAKALNPGAVTASGGYRAVSKKAPTAGEWHHLVGVFDKAGHNVRLYVDGELNTTISIPPTVKPWRAEGHTILGAAKWDGKQVDYTTGAIDNVHLYQRILSEGEIKDLYNKKS